MNRPATLSVVLPGFQRRRPGQAEFPEPRFELARIPGAGPIGVHVAGAAVGYGVLQTQDRRPLDVDDAFVLHGTPHFTAMTTRTSLRQGDQRLQLLFPLLTWTPDALRFL